MPQRTVLENQIVKEVVRHYLNSGDYNGIGLESLIHADTHQGLDAVRVLIRAGTLEIVSEAWDFPVIKRTVVPDTSVQLKALLPENCAAICVYPTTKCMSSRLPRGFALNRPFKRLLALGHPQLEPLFFELGVLHRYQSDPRYIFDFKDLAGHISITDAHYRSRQMPGSDKVLIQSFGLGTGPRGERTIVVFLSADLAPTFQIDFGPHTYNPNAGVAEYPVRHGPVLIVHQPTIASDHVVQKALLEDARKNHYVDLIAAWEKCCQSVLRHSQHRHKLIGDVAREIQDFSGLPAHPAENPMGPYVMQLQLAMVVYERLMEQGQAALKIEQHPDGACLTNGGANWAKGQPEQMKAIMEKMDDLISANREQAAEWKRELGNMEKERSALVSALSYELASKALPGMCGLVPFFEL